MSLESPISKTRLVGEQLNRWLNRLQETVGQGTLRSVLALGDQALVSGARFATTVVIGRTCGAGELGAYGLCFTFVVLFSSALQSLVTLPYTVYWKKRHASRRDSHAGSVLLHLIVLCFVASTSMLCASLISAVFPGGERIRHIFLALSVFLPGLLLWEFVRRIGFAHLRVRTVFLLDFVAAVLFVTSLTFLAAGGMLSAVTAYIVMGTLFGATAVICLAHYGQVFRPNRRRSLLEAVRNWRFGRWILASETLFMARGYVVPWLVAALLGTTSTGVFVAYLTIVAFANPLLHGVSNVLAPDLARAHVDQGMGEVRRLAIKATLALGVATLLLGIVLSIFGESIVGLLYGPEFLGHPLCVIILAAGFFSESVGMAAYNGLWAIGRSDACFVACLGGLAATVLVTLCLTPWWGLAGAAGGIFAGRFTATLMQCIAFHRIVRDTTIKGAIA